ncbi:glycosyltransferase [Arcobacter sp. CECT 8985]|uniref:glycosyltransferase n=1 Tax=Arcobacter sp. CECT 8985 TaxID=1935424 RepID=UPI00100AC5D0|nr:glycosyltransferase [Arcobacter sp. CECT 8985]RXJ84866.1 hypothetical protein CRU93_11870 [Arcobacter sp. CECT 8985]
MSKKIAFIDHSFHKKTKSSNFFLDLLKDKYTIDIYYDTKWEDKKVLDFDSLNQKNYSIIIFWQINYNIKFLKKLKCKNIIYIPMYDDFIANTFTPFYWKQFNSIKFISFSKNLHDYLHNKGLDSLYIKYFPEINKSSKKIDKKNLTAFFWYRIEAINWEKIKELISPNSFKKIYIQNHPDPNQKKLQIFKEDIEKYNIEIIDWFESKDEYTNLLKSIDVYFAPRIYEGIGLSFLELMKQGKYIVAFDKPTMNEYIIHKKNGFLYSNIINNKVDFSNINQIEIFKMNQKYYDEYKKNKKEIYTLIESSFRSENIKRDYLYMYIDKLFKFPSRVFRKIFK